MGVKAETFPFQIYGSIPAGLSRLSGFTDTIPDVVGRIDSHASLVIFSEGNHFPVLLPLALDGFRDWLRQKGRALRNDNIVIFTLPQSMLFPPWNAEALRSGRRSFQWTGRTVCGPTSSWQGIAP